MVIVEREEEANSIQEPIRASPCDQACGLGIQPSTSPSDTFAQIVVVCIRLSSNDYLSLLERGFLSDLLGFNLMAPAVENPSTTYSESHPEVPNKILAY